MALEIRQVVKPAAVDEHADQHQVSMRDGVRLATDVYLPNRHNRVEAILVRTPYDKSSRYCALPHHARYFAERGYALVAQDCRGKFRSEGETVPYTTDVADAYDTVDWITHQPWSNGVVGLLGASYYGYTTWAGVASGHPAIRAAIPQCTGLELPDLHMASRWRQVVPNLWGADDLIQIWTDPSDYYVTIDYSRRPIIEAFQEASARLGPCRGMDILLAKSKSGETVNPFGDSHPFWTTNIPILHWAEWFDHALGPLGLRDWAWFRALPGRRDLHFMRANSADHGGFLLEDVPRRPENDYDVNDKALELKVAGEVREEADFFDMFLRQRPAQVLAGDRRVAWHLGHVGWQHAADWPLTATSSEYFLVAPANPSTDPSGALAPRPDAQATALRWIHDPNAPVPSSTTQDEVWTFLHDYPDESELCRRSDVLTFTTDALDQHLDVVGPISTFLAIKSSAHSMHIFAKLFDVTPKGAVLLVSRGQVVIDGGVKLVQVDMSPTAYRFRPQHRLRLAVMSSDYPSFIVHPGTDENPWLATKTSVVENTLTTGGLTGSRLELSTLPFSA